MAEIKTIVSDFGGVLTTPLIESFMAFQDKTGITTETLGKAMQAAAEDNGEPRRISFGASELDPAVLADGRVEGVAGVSLPMLVRVLSRRNGSLPGRRFCSARTLAAITCDNKAPHVAPCGAGNMPPIGPAKP